MTLGRIAVEHPSLLAADFRELYGNSPYMMRVDEACLLLRVLLEDSRSRLAAHLAGWAYPVSREWMMLAFVHDVIVDTTPGLKNGNRFHMPRPWLSNVKKLGGKSKRTAAEALAILRPE